MTVENYMLKGDYGQKCKSDTLYVNYPYLIESDNNGFMIRFKKEYSEDEKIGMSEEAINEGKTIFSTKQSKFRVENFDIYGGWIELEAYRDNATLSYIKLYTNNTDNTQYNTHICINNEEKATIRNVIVKIQGETDPTC